MLRLYFFFQTWLFDVFKDRYSKVRLKLLSGTRNIHVQDIGMGETGTFRENATWTCPCDSQPHRFVVSKLLKPSKWCQLSFPNMICCLSDHNVNPECGINDLNMWWNCLCTTNSCALCTETCPTVCHFEYMRNSKRLYIICIYMV